MGNAAASATQEPTLMLPSKTAWTAPMEERLLQLLGKGLSYLDIAKIISREFTVVVSKNACIGKGRRMQVALRMPARKGSACRKRNARKNREGRSRQQSGRRNSPRKRRVERKNQQHRQSLKHRARQSSGRDLTLLQLLPTSCRWPSGNSPNVTFCGADKADGSSYCLKHALIASPGFGRER